MDVKSRIFRVFESNGLDYADTDSLSETDSLAYISTIVGLENEFGIQFPDEVLAKNMFEDLPNLLLMVENLCSGENTVKNLVANDEVFERYGENLETLLNLVSRLVALLSENDDRVISSKNPAVVGLKLMDLFEQKEGLPYCQNIFALRDQISALITKSSEYTSGMFEPEVGRRPIMNTAIFMDVMHLYGSLDSCEIYPGSQFDGEEVSNENDDIT